jgi:hypothetical protein
MILGYHQQFTIVAAVQAVARSEVHLNDKRALTTLKLMTIVN